MLYPSRLDQPRYQWCQLTTKLNGGIFILFLLSRYQFLMQSLNILYMCIISKY
jgi:hypothetical protein